MNGWEVFTWISAAALAGTAAVIFVLFLRDAGAILRQLDGDDEDDGDS